MDETRYMLLAVFKGTVLDKVAGIRGVVILLLQYTNYDVRWKKWSSCFVIDRVPYRMMTRNLDFEESDVKLNLSRRTQFETDKKTLDHFLGRLRSYPNITQIEVHTAFLMLAYIKHVLTYNWDFDETIYLKLIERLFHIFKRAPFNRHMLTQEVYRLYGLFSCKGRFANKEVQNMNYVALNAEGIAITHIHDDFKGCDAILTTSKQEWVQLSTRIPNDYPFRAPVLTFNGSLRPKRFRRYERIKIDDHYEYPFTAVADSLRAVLLEMELDGVTSEIGNSVVFL